MYSVGDDRGMEKSVKKKTKTSDFSLSWEKGWWKSLIPYTMQFFRQKCCDRKRDLIWSYFDHIGRDLKPKISKCSHFIGWISKMALQPKLSVVWGVPYHVSKNWTVCCMIIKFFCEEISRRHPHQRISSYDFYIFYRRLWKIIFSIFLVQKSCRKSSESTWLSAGFL